MLALLDRDVEVVDLLPTRRAARAANPEIPLFERSGNHPSGLGMKRAGEQVAEHLSRYQFAARRPGAFDEKRRTGTERIDRSVPQKVWQVLDVEGNPFEPVEDSEVLVIGDSNVFAYGSASFTSHIARAAGLPVSELAIAGGGATAHQRLASAGEASIRDRRVVIWIFSAVQMARDGWQRAPIPVDADLSLLLETGDLDAFLAGYSRAAAGREEPLGLDEARLSRAALQGMQEGELDRALEVARINTVENEWLAGPFVRLGQLALETGDRDTALEALERARRRHPDTRLRETLIALYARLGLPAPAIESYVPEPGELADLAGRYVAGDGTEVLVEPGEEGLDLTVAGAPRRRLRPVAPRVFNTADGEVARFRGGAGAEDLELEIRGPGLHLSGTRTTGD
jgi:hypothetical protein